MFGEKIESGRLSAWIIVAVTAPIASLYGGNWLGVLAVGLISAAICICMERTCRQQVKLNPVLSALQWAWITLFAAAAARKSTTCWEGDVLPVIPLVLIAISAFAACGGGERASRVCGTLVWLVSGVFLVVLLAGVGDMEWKRIEPKPELPSSELLAVFLLPCLSVYLNRQKHMSNWTCLFPAVFAIAISIGVGAALSPSKCAEVDNPFYEYAKGITMFGTVRRFEALVACALTVGWFALLSYLFSIAGCLFQSKLSVALAAGTAAAMVLAGIRMPTIVLVVTQVAFCSINYAKEIKQKKG